MGSSCCQAQGDDKIELQQQEKIRLKSKASILNKNSNLSTDQNKENERIQSYQNNGSLMIDDTGKEYNRIAASSLEIQELTGDMDRVDSIQLTENAVKDKPIMRDSCEVISLGSKKTILKKETKYSLFRIKANFNQNQKKVRFDEVYTNTQMVQIDSYKLSQQNFTNLYECIKNQKQQVENIVPLFHLLFLFYIQVRRFIQTIFMYNQ
ncbi:unnamed protein product (macronuclear) [Paramecium tetraurelia]|uniref:Uncharacterized protein n=1 Tax=Paramecium tetraurelia TaxID=5888 RepID=A0D9V8_PARTE|nr:uncharacterized protein GSPATT00014757001 [Paramecium tetraurelia]CAK79825.1 unnamed protein product [Paramecium tetraurelia]|eukprot:XP_001447222.1 hypothetical protein (macronuclear) [Paramecium tetraurelia strain d4-2]